jgi:hypothetical protein
MRDSTHQVNASLNGEIEEEAPDNARQSGPNSTGPVECQCSEFAFTSIILHRVSSGRAHRQRAVPLKVAAYHRAFT